MKKSFYLAFIAIFAAVGTLGAQSITVTSPYPQMTWNNGTEYTIRWSANGQMDATVRIILRRNGALFRMINDNTPNDGSYDWTIPADIPEGSYVIRVRTNPGQYAGVGGDSNLFHIKPPPTPAIEVYQPHAGDHWLKGQPYVIRWHKNGELHTRVYIELFNQAGTQQVMNIAFRGVADNSGHYSWTVPASVTPGNYRIKVKDYVNQVEDLSDIFEITGAAKFIAITTPEPMTGLCMGQVRRICWASGGLTGNVNLYILTQGGLRLGTIGKYVPIAQGYFDWQVGKYKPEGQSWLGKVGSSMQGGDQLKVNKYYKIKIVHPGEGINFTSSLYLLMNCQ